ncbi:hypothetical protein ACW7N6_38400 [Streptomyces sp. UC1A3]
MKTETYKGRTLKVIRSRGRESGFTRVFVNGEPQGSYLGSEERALRSLRGTVDHADEVGVGSGRYAPHWYAPGTYELCPEGHAKPLDGPCGHPWCMEQREAVDARTEGFYVTVRDGAKVGFLLGPYATHDEALANVDRAREEVMRRDPFGCSFWGFGTAKATAKPGRELKPGKLNDAIGQTAGD